MKAAASFMGKSVQELFEPYLDQHGNKGSEFITDTNMHTPYDDDLCYVKLQVIATATINAITSTADAPMRGTALTGVAFAAGTILYGKFTSIDLTSGSLIAYFGRT